MEALHSSAVELWRAKTIDSLTDLTINALQRILEFEFCEVSLVGENTVRILKSSRPGDVLEMPLDGPGIVVRAVNTGETQYVPDIRLDPDYVEGGKRDESGKVFDILSELVVPVKIGGKVQLILNMERSKVDAFSLQDRRLAEILAAHTASAFELIQERMRRVTYTKKLESLYTVTKMLPSASSIDELAAKIETAAREIIGFDLGSFGLVKDDALHHEYIWGVDLGNPIVLPLNGPGVTVRAVQSGETQLVNDTLLDEDHINPEASGITRSELCVPVKVMGEVVGVINVESRSPNAFSENENTLLSILAEHVGSTIYNIRLRVNEQDYVKKLDLLSRNMSVMNTCESINELASETLSIVDKIMQIPYSSFSLVKDDVLVFIDSHGIPLLDIYLPTQRKGITAKAAREKRTILVPDIRLDPDFVKGSTDSLSELIVPILIEDKPVGVINMKSLDVGYFNSTHQSLAEVLAANVASNMQRLHREEATREAEKNAIREKERAEQALMLDEMKTNFIRIATHEIRTPLTSIMGYTQLAQLKIEESNNPDLVRYFEAILRNTERLESLSADLLDLQRIESGHIELNIAPVNIGEVLKNIALEMKPIIEARDQTLKIDGGNYLIKADRIRMIQIIINLLTNASKFSPEGSTIKVTVEKEDNLVKISVIDEGIGIKHVDIPKLFKPFPGIPVKGVKDSVGLGLSICKGLVELHGGTIWAESDDPGKGSKFTFTCPCISD